MSEPLTAAQAKSLADFLRKIFQEIAEPLHTKLTAHMIVIVTLKQMHPDLAPIIDALLAETYASSALRDSMHERYHVALEKFLRRVVEHARDLESLETQFRDLKPTFLN